MTSLSIPFRPLMRLSVKPVLIAFALLLALVAGFALWAQVEGDRGIAPLANSTDIEVYDIEVDATGKTAQEAREEAWQKARRLAWEKIDGPDISDSQLDSMVSAIVIQNEQIGTHRYIATLGVIFDRTRAGALLGAGGPRARSAPMLTVPVLISGGTDMVYETRNDWQRAWAEYQAGSSAIDYVRPAGAGGESLLVNYGQLGRRSRAWWRGILDYFGAADVIIPIAKIEHQWPGGPVEGHFIARYGPDNRLLGEFTMRAESDSGMREMYDRAIVRFDEIFAKALADGVLRPDPTLESERVEIAPAIQALLDSARRASEEEAAAAAGEVVGPVDTAAPPPAVVVNAYPVQYVTPDATAVDAGLVSVRGTPGVRGAATTSIAIGGVSVMRVSYGGSMSELAAALRARGWQVTEGSGALSISR